MPDALPLPTLADRLASPATARPTLFVVVDTEEEFDWSAPFDRARTQVTAMRHAGRAQRLFDRVRLRPTYVVDYPVATQAAGIDELASWQRDGRCVVGAHLHPWVTPPFDEPVDNRHSFMCNLPPALQHAKVAALTEAVEAATGRRPRSFKAGRYGLASAGCAVLEALGYHVDLSVNPAMDFRAIDGPDFHAFDPQPYWLRRATQLLEVPCTHGYVGLARAAGGPLRRLAERPVLHALRAPGILARLGLVNRVMLSPEGNTLDEMIALTRALLADGVRVFSFTFHSPSLAPGHTPYVRTQADLDDFLARIDGYLDFFFGGLAGVAGTPEDFRRDLLGTNGSATS
jgi:hypothetical protein